MNALTVLKPPEKLTVSEWADKYRILSELDSAAPGHWRTSKTPYLKQVMDAFNDGFIHDITFCAGSQLGKTSAEQNMRGYAIAQDPGPMMIVYPSEKLAKFTSEKRLQPLIQLSWLLTACILPSRGQTAHPTFPAALCAISSSTKSTNFRSGQGRKQAPWSWRQSVPRPFTISRL